MKIHTPETQARRSFTDADEAVAYLIALYEAATQFLCSEFSKAMAEGAPNRRIRAFYPEVRF